jgi:hypothetical protein
MSNHDTETTPALFDTALLAAQHPDEPLAKTNRPVEINSYPEAEEPEKLPEQLPEQLALDGIRRAIALEDEKTEEDIDRYDNDSDGGHGKRREEAKVQNGKPDRAVPTDKSSETQQTQPKEKKQRGNRPVNRNRLSARDKAVADGPPDHIRKQNRERGIY